eukprot:gene22491-25485_t
MIKYIGTRKTSEGGTLYVFLINGLQKEVRESALKQYPGCYAGVAEVAAASGLRMQPFIIEQTAPAGAGDSGLSHDWPAPATGVDKHRGYAFQWYAL